MSEEKAVLISAGHKRECSICMLLDTEATKDITWHVVEEDVNPDKDSVVCSKCLEGMRELRKLCHQKVDNPHHKVLENYIPWFAKEIPDFEKIFAAEKEIEK